MRRRVPLNAVRAFEASARHLNLVRAADELCVTPTAVSHQIRLLEDFLQVKLFLRKNGRLEMTPGSRACFEQLADALDDIDAALAAVGKPADAPRRVVIGASPSLTSLWLLPRLQRFCGQAPEIDVVVNTFQNRAAIEADSNDLSIFSWHTKLDRRIDLLMEEEIVPVCAPDLLRETGLSGADALRELPLVHDDKREIRASGHFPTWERYLGDYGIARPDTSKGLRFNQSCHAIEAAIEGHGVLLGRSLLVQSALDSGRLARVAEPYPVRFPYFVISAWQATSQAGAQFRDWLLEEAGASTLAPA